MVVRVGESRGRAAAGIAQQVKSLTRDFDAGGQRVFEIPRVEPCREIGLVAEDGLLGVALRAAPVHAGDDGTGAAVCRRRAKQLRD